MAGFLSAGSAFGDTEPATGYGALAIDEGDCSRAGLAIGYVSSVEADSVALEECGEGCSIVERFSGGCVAFVSDGSDESEACGWATGARSESEAAAAALEECRAAGGTDCVMRLSDCGAAEPFRLMAGEGPEAATDPPRRSAGETFRDCPNCPEMVVIPAGMFRMGCLSNDDDCYYEFPVHEVTVQSFALSKYEVTFDEWDACVADGGCNGYEPNHEGTGNSYVIGTGNGDDVGPVIWGRGSRPVINISWEDAQAFIAWLSGVTGGVYRLPSEAEWEYAARAGTETKYSWGNDIGNNQASCNEEGRYQMGLGKGFWLIERGTGCGDSWLQVTAPVGSFGANAFGLYDMHGNVQEWVEDCLNDDYAGAPSDGSAWLSGDCTYRVLRGGSWKHYPPDLRSASRDYKSADSRFMKNEVGFRVARTLTP